MIIEEIIDGRTHVINPPKSNSVKEEIVFDMDDQPIGSILNSNNGIINGNAPVKAEFVENDVSDQYFIGTNYCNICDCSIEANKFTIHNSYHHSLPGDALYDLWFKRSSRYPCAKCLLQFDDKSQIRNHIRSHMIQDYDLNTMQQKIFVVPQHCMRNTIFSSGFPGY